MLRFIEELDLLASGLLVTNRSGEGGGRKVGGIGGAKDPRGPSEDVRGRVHSAAVFWINCCVCIFDGG